MSMSRIVAAFPLGHAIMRRRRLLLVVGAVVLLGMAGFVLLLWLTSQAPAPGITWDNFRRLRMGMSVGDVEALLGEPHEIDDLGDGYVVKWWRSQEVTIGLGFNANQRLHLGTADPTGVSPICAESLHPPESVLDRLRQWLHW